MHNAGPACALVSKPLCKSGDQPAGHLACLCDLGPLVLSIAAAERWWRRCRCTCRPTAQVRPVTFCCAAPLAAAAAWGWPSLASLVLRGCEPCAAAGEQLGSAPLLQHAAAPHFAPSPAAAPRFHFLPLPPALAPPADTGRRRRVAASAAEVAMLFEVHPLVIQSLIGRWGCCGLNGCLGGWFVMQLRC